MLHYQSFIGARDADATPRPPTALTGDEAAARIEEAHQ